jgi:hypothetical protein
VQSYGASCIHSILGENMGCRQYRRLNIVTHDWGSLHVGYYLSPFVTLFFQLYIRGWYDLLLLASTLESSLTSNSPQIFFNLVLDIPSLRSILLHVCNLYYILEHLDSVAQLPAHLSRPVWTLCGWVLNHQNKTCEYKFISSRYETLTLHSF